MGKGYSSDDNRSMQLNPNNDRYYSSRGIDRDDLDWDYDENDNNETGENMLFTIGKNIINSQNISSIELYYLDIDFNIKEVDNHKYDRYSRKSKKKIRMLSVLVDVEADLVMNNESTHRFQIDGRKTDGTSECEYVRPSWGPGINHSSYFPEIDYNLSLRPRVFNLDDSNEDYDDDAIQNLKEKIKNEIRNTVNQFIIAYVNKAMKRQRDCDPLRAS